MVCIKILQRGQVHSVPDTVCQSWYLKDEERWRKNKEIKQGSWQHRRDYVNVSQSKWITDMPESYNWKCMQIV